MTGAPVKALNALVGKDRAVPDNLKLGELGGEGRVMTKLMMQYVEQVRTEPRTYIRDRTGWERLLNSFPAELREAGGRLSSRPIMFKDPWF